MTPGVQRLQANPRGCAVSNTINSLYDSPVYLTNSIGKYALGSWGASSTRSALHLLKDVGKLGGSFDSE